MYDHIQIRVIFIFMGEISEFRIASHPPFAQLNHYHFNYV